MEQLKKKKRVHFSPHFSHRIYSGSGSGRAYCVALGRPPQEMRDRLKPVPKSPAGASGHPLAGHAPCIHSHLHCLATIGSEKCGLVDDRAALCYFGQLIDRI